MSDIEEGIKRMGFDAEMAHNLSEIVRITRETAISECAMVAEAEKPGFCGDTKDSAVWATAERIANRIRDLVGDAPGAETQHRGAPKV